MGTLWDLHARLSALSISGREPALRQIRLTWWRDSLTQLGSTGLVPAEPLLQRIATDLLPVISSAVLANLAEARSVIIGEHWRAASVEQYGECLFAASQLLLGGKNDGGRVWALVDAAIADPDSGRASTLLGAARGARLGMSNHRALKTLDYLAQLIAKRNGARSRVREQLAVLRVGIFGR